MHLLSSGNHQDGTSLKKLGENVHMGDLARNMTNTLVLQSIMDTKIERSTMVDQDKVWVPTRSLLCVYVYVIIVTPIYINRSPVYMYILL